MVVCYGRQELSVGERAAVVAVGFLLDRFLFFGGWVLLVDLGDVLRVLNSEGFKRFYILVQWELAKGGILLVSVMNLELEY